MYAHIGYVGAFLLPIENDPSAWAHTDPCRAPIDGSRRPPVAPMTFTGEDACASGRMVHSYRLSRPRVVGQVRSVVHSFRDCPESLGGIGVERVAGDARCVGAGSGGVVWVCFLAVFEVAADDAVEQRRVAT
ncbi:MAG: hypothetical protein QOF95_1497 [Pseudonocardiales bacterium]|nr:hypothetical protein [Pseudonocardiales bacterium]